MQGELTPLHVAADEGHTEVAALLLDKGADIEAKDDVRAPSALRMSHPLPHAPLH